MQSSIGCQSKQQASRRLWNSTRQYDVSRFGRRILHKEDTNVAQASSSSNGAPSTVPSTSTPKDYSISLFDALKFNGPAPELINGRLAMLGFVAGALEETHSGLTFAQQAAQLPLSELLLLALWVYASLVPILKGAKLESFGWFTPRAEITNGRAAMLGIAVLLFLEDTAGVPFF